MNEGWLTPTEIGQITHLVDWALIRNGEGRDDKRWKIYQRMMYLAELGAAFMMCQYVFTSLLNWESVKTKIKNAGRVKAVKTLESRAAIVLDHVRHEA